MDIVQLIISLISGLIGGNAAGAALKDKSLGTVGNSVTGAIGGGIGGYLLQALDIIGKTTAAAGTTAAATGAGGFDIGSLLGNIGGSGVSGAILMVVVSLIKSYLNKSS